MIEVPLVTGGGNPFLGQGPCLARCAWRHRGEGVLVEATEEREEGRAAVRLWNGACPLMKHNL
jgi:hypothetical protein